MISNGLAYDLLCDPGKRRQPSPGGAHAGVFIDDPSCFEKWPGVR